jgi:hypothetical protein
MAAKRLCLSFTADQLTQEDLAPAPRGLVLSELSDWLNEIEGIILSDRTRLILGGVQFDIDRLKQERTQIHQNELTILQEVLRKAGFELTIEYKNPFQRHLYIFDLGEYDFCEWKSNALLLIRRLR